MSQHVDLRIGRQRSNLSRRPPPRREAGTGPARMVRPTRLISRRTGSLSSHVTARGSSDRKTTKQPLTPTASPSRGRHRASSDGETDAAHLPPDRLVVQSCHSTWIFDPQHLRFRRILKGIEVGHRSVATEWRPYWKVQLDVEGDGFTV